MELEGLKRVLGTLANLDVKVTSLTTDRHRQIALYMKKANPGIIHIYDPWHIAKSTLMNCVYCIDKAAYVHRQFIVFITSQMIFNVSKV